MEVAGIPGVIPLLALYPNEVVRRNTSAQDWEVFLQSWLFSIEFRLRLDKAHFGLFKFSHPASGVAFLSSYLQEYAFRSEPIESGSLEAKLHHRSYFLLKRLLLETAIPSESPSPLLFELLGVGSVAFHAIADWRSSLKQIWLRDEPRVKGAIESCKTAIIKSSLQDTTSLVHKLHQLTALVRCMPEAAVTAVTGSDYLEASLEHYSTASAVIQKAMTHALYYGLAGLLNGAAKHVSLLLDTVFELKVGADRSQGKTTSQPTLLSSLLCTTPFLKHLKANTSITGGKRGQTLLQSLLEYRQLFVHLHPETLDRPGRTGKRKGKGKARADVDANEAMHVHKASQVSEVHELFPDLPGGYILRLLDQFDDDVERVVAALLEPDSLPAHLRQPTAQDSLEVSVIDAPVDLAPRSTPPPPQDQRRNVFDNDEFDRLQISSTRLHKGRKQMDDEPPTAAEHSRSKAAILAALAAFDADDDERDDTYDIADVGGAVDNTLDTDARGDTRLPHQVEEILFKAWLANPELYSRDSKTRMSTVRRQLADDTKMDNEQLEGWAIMLSRDVKLQDRLRQKYAAVATFQGGQNAVASTKWRTTESPGDSPDEGHSAPDDGRRIGATGIRGARNWNRGRGRGSTSGPANEHSTQMARKRKEQGRGRGGASNRREGRAKKMGRGMGLISQG